MQIMLKANERIDDLQLNNLKIIQNNTGFCFGIDSILLSDFAKEIRKGSKVADLGTGTGILPILLSAKTKNTKIIGIEIQKHVVEMANRSVILNNLQDRIEIICENIKNLKEKYKTGSFDVIVSNPPYKKIGTGEMNKIQTKLISRHEITANLEDFINIASYLLKDQGVIYLVHKPERLVDIFYNLRKYRLEPKLLKIVQPSVEKVPNLVLVKAVKNGKQFLKIEKPLIIYKNGEYTEEVLKIYSKN